MKILHVVASYLPAVRYGGTIVSVHGLCRALAARGHDVHVLTTSVDGPLDSPVPHRTAVPIDGVSVWYFQSRHLRRLYYAPDLARHLSAQVGGFDVVHTHALFLWPLWAAARAAKRAGVPYVLSPRGMLERQLFEKKNPVLKSLWLGMIEKQNLEGAAAIHVTSRREADEASAFGLRLPPFVEIPNGVDAWSVADGVPWPAIAGLADGEPFLLFLGRISWKKGLDRLLRALAHAPAVRVVIAGNDDEGYSGALRAQVAGLGLGDRVVFAGPVWGVDKATLLSAAAAVVLPSYSENFGNVVIEAMAAAKPVIVTPEVGVADVVLEASAGLVVDGHPAALGAAIARLMADPQLRREMGGRGARLASTVYRWDAVAERMESAYEGIAE